MATARKILQEALQLDAQQRATLALELMDSLAPPRDEDEWLEEIEQRARRILGWATDGVDPDCAPLSPEQSAVIRRRSAEIDAGTAKLVDGDEALRAVRARIEARRR